MQNHYSYPEIIDWLQTKGTELFGPHFNIPEHDHPVVYRLIAYFLKDEQAAFQFGLDLSRGILLAGPVGCGKTSLMTLMKYLAPPDRKFILKPCRDISFEFINDGYSTIHKYAKGKLYETEARIYCLDDLGVENNLKYYGNECNVLAEILLSRYDIFISKRLPTHITTNLSASEIENHYGLRVRSRLREMVNLIAYNKNAKDKR